MHYFVLCKQGLRKFIVTSHCLLDIPDQLILAINIDKLQADKVKTVKSMSRLVAVTQV